MPIVASGWLGEALGDTHFEVKAAEETKYVEEPFIQGIYSPITPTTRTGVNSVHSAPVAYDARTLSVIAYIEHVFGKDAEIAKVVFKCESNFRTDVISRTNDVGIAQINLAAHGAVIPGATRVEKIIWLSDYANNINFAKQLYDRVGWSAWVCYQKLY